MTTIPCFMIEETDLQAQYLRRYASGSQCPVGRYHDAAVRIEDGRARLLEDGYLGIGVVNWPHDDPRWPTRCACGYAFTEADQWQLFNLQLYRDPRDGKLYVTHEGSIAAELRAPVGAMFRAKWLEPTWAGPDGISLALMTPAGVWLIDHPPTWQRTGTPPKVTANPSILFPGQYHGWLRDGQLVEV